MRKMSAGGSLPPARTPKFLSPWLGCVAAALIATAMPAPAQAERGFAYEVAAEIRSEVGRDLRDFYRTRGYRPIWIHGDRLGPEADRLLALVASADLDGLDPADYDPGDLRRVIEKAGRGSPEALGRAEVELSKTLAAYVRDVRRSPSVKMTYLDKEVEPTPPSAVAVLRTAVRAPSLESYLEEGSWANPVYSKLRAALAEYRARWGSLPEFALSTGPALRLGSKGERVRMLRQRLGLPDGLVFDRALADEVGAFQAAHGLPVDGIVGSGTIGELNRGSAYHEDKIRLNMERARALPPLSSGRFIVVDTAAARLFMYGDGELQDTMRVIVGKPTQPSPMLAGMVRYAIVNPYWNVPPDLVRTSILPKLQKRDTSLKAMGYEALSAWTRDARVLEPSEIDWDAVASGREELRVRQLPGKGNAMGKMKFMFPNDLGIYLHDTPDKDLFDKDGRRFSSGCIRLEDAARLGEWLFGKPLKTKSDDPEQYVSLPEPIPVYLTYLTAAPTDDGIAFREDAYGRDEAPMDRYASR